MIKNFKCPECKVVSSAEQWNKETEEYYGKGIDVIEGNNKDNSYYACPSCKLHDIDGEDIIEIV